MDNRITSRIGIGTVQNIVEGPWGCGWQEYGATNDDAVDAIILMRRGRKKAVDTGGVVFVQVKCGTRGYRREQRQYPDHIGIFLGRKYIEDHMPRWRRLPGPAVLVFVDDANAQAGHPAWWVSLRSECVSPTNRGMILIPKSQRFSHHSKGDFHALCGGQPGDRQLETVKVTAADLPKFKLGKDEDFRKDVWEFYKGWRAERSQRQHPVLGEILVNRVGWKHITRRGRSPHRVINSWLLLGAAKRMVSEVNSYQYLGHARIRPLSSGAKEVVDYLGVRSRVVFPHRHEATIQVVLKRQRVLMANDGSLSKQRIWFYSVYEPRRGMAGPE